MEKIPVSSNALRDMFKLQKEIVDDYIQLEGLPNYPVDVHSREGQKVLKSFAHRLINELAESFEQLTCMLIGVMTNQSRESEEHLRKYNMEIADAWHFMLEFLIFAGYGTDERITYLLNRYTAKEDNHRFSSMIGNMAPLKAMLTMGDYKNQMVNKGMLRTNLTAYRIVDQEASVMEPDLTGGHRINHNLFEDHQQGLWLVTYAMSMVTQSLTNRDHHQTEKAVNLIQFEDDLAETLIQWGTYLSFAGFTEISIYNCYRHKNLINQERIKTGY